jgi:hypothetical protein
VLTCKSLFGLGYRGERLIEPSRLVGGSHIKSVASGCIVDRTTMCTRDCQIAGTSCQAFDTVHVWKRTCDT